VLLDAHVFIDVAKQELLQDRHPVLAKLLNSHKLILNKRLRKHYSGVLYKKGESALRYIDSVVDVAPVEHVSSGEYSTIRLDSGHKPSHSKDVFLCMIAIAAKRKSNEVILVSEDPHLSRLDPVYHSDDGIRIVPANYYVQHFCSEQPEQSMLQP
jgi:hypothetical protein